jgi:hypothetical protein
MGNNGPGNQKIIKIPIMLWEWKFLRNFMGFSIVWYGFSVDYA